MKSGAGGFTLLELVVVMAAVAVLATLAVPAWHAHVERVHRTEAVSAMLAIQQAQERWRSAHPTYAAGLGPDGIARPPQSRGGRFALATAVDRDTQAFAYSVTAVATAAPAGPCTQLQLEVERGRITQRSGADAQLGNTAADNRRCWGLPP